MSASLASRMAVLPVFRSVEAPALERLAAASTVRTLSAGESLWRAGDAARWLTVLLHGLVEVRRPTPGGDSALVALFGPREVVGLTAVLERGTWPAEALAVSKTVDALRIPAADVHDTLDRSPPFVRGVQGALIAHSHALNAKIDVLSAGPVPRRLAALFLHLADRFGDEGEGGATHIPVALSRVRLASLVAARVETVIRALGRWRASGWLETSATGFTLRAPAALRALLDG